MTQELDWSDLSKLCFKDKPDQEIVAAFKTQRSHRMIIIHDHFRDDHFTRHFNEKGEEMGVMPGEPRWYIIPRPPKTVRLWRPEYAIRDDGSIAISGHDWREKEYYAKNDGHWIYGPLEHRDFEVRE